MERLLAIMLLMSLLTVSCNKSGDGSSEESSTSTTSTIDGSDTAPSTDANTDTGTDTTTDTDPVVVNPPTEPDPVVVTPPVEPDPVIVEPPADPDPVVVTPPPTPDSDSTLPALALSFQTNVTYLSGFDSSDEAKYNKAVALVKKVVATEAFRDAVLNHTYGGVKQFVQNNGLTNAQIYQSILDAAEKLKPAKNNTMDVGVKLYYENSNTVGYTSGSITYINVNTKYFDTYAVNSVAGNLFHEWLHKLGYGHDSAATTRRPYSVPYAVGYMIRTIGKNFL